MSSPTPEEIKAREEEIAQRVKKMRDQEVREFLTGAIIRLEVAVDRLESLAQRGDEGDSSA